MPDFTKKVGYTLDYLSYSVQKFTRETSTKQPARFKSMAREVVEQVFHPDRVTAASKLAQEKGVKELLTSRVTKVMGGKESEKAKEREKAELWLKANDLDPNLAKTEGFVDFLKKTKLHEYAKLQGHEIRNDKNKKQPMFMVKGEYITYENFLKKYELNEILGETLIFDKKTEVLQDYTKQGLGPIDFKNIQKKAPGKTAEPLTPEEAWLKDRNLVQEFTKVEGFIDFLKNTKIYSIARFYEHPIPFDDDSLQPLLMVNGEYITFQQFLKEYKVIDVGGEFQIINKSTNKRCSYLDKGIVEHDPAKEIVPFKYEAPSKKYTVSFIFYAKGHTDSVSGLRNYRRHSWINLKNPKGEVFSMGALSNGHVTSPDPYEFLPEKKKSVTFEITRDQYEELQKMAADDQSARSDGEFNWLNNNCSTFSGRIAGHLFPTVTPRSKLEENNTLEHRIKAFVYSREMTNELMKPEALQKLKEVRTTIRNSKNIKEDSAKVALAAATVQQFKGIFTHALGPTQMDDMSGDAMVKLILSDVTRNGADGLITDIIESVERGDKNGLQDKIHNLMWDIFEVNHNLEIDHPSQLLSQIKKQPGSKVETV